MYYEDLNIGGDTLLALAQTLTVEDQNYIYIYIFLEKKINNTDFKL